MPKIRVRANRWHKSFTCRAFGHIFDGYAGSTPYGRVSIFTEDGIRRVHCRVICACDRCDEKVEVVKFHLPDGWQVEDKNGRHWGIPLKAEEAQNALGER